MGAVTYPDAKVVSCIEQTLIPVQVSFDAKPLSDDFNIKWTPTIIVLDADGKEHHRIVGFLPPEEFVPALILGIAKSHFDRGQFREAISLLGQLIKDYPNSDAAPEATYLQGVAGYKNTHDPKPLKEAYDKLQKGYPSSEWTKRASPYRLL